MSAPRRNLVINIIGGQTFKYSKNIIVEMLRDANAIVSDAEHLVFHSTTARVHGIGTTDGDSALVTVIVF